MKCSAFCVHTPARIFTPVAKDAGTACTSVSQSEDAYSRAESKSPGRDLIARKSASHSDWVLQPPSGRWAARLKPLQWAWVREEKRRRGVKKERARFFMIFLFVGRFRLWDGEREKYCFFCGRVEDEGI